MRKDGSPLTLRVGEGPVAGPGAQPLGLPEGEDAPSSSKSRSGSLLEPLPLPRKGFLEQVPSRPRTLEGLLLDG